MSSQHLIAEFALPINIPTFCNLFLYSDEWYENFLSKSLQDINISISTWNENEADQSKVREVKSHHPSKVSFPGLPSHAESLKIQKLILHSNGRSLDLIETNKFNGIPMCDYFRVDTVWKVEEMGSIPATVAAAIPAPGSVASQQQSGEDISIRIRISCEVVFFQSTWLKGTIESNTKSELLSVFTLWKDAAIETIIKYQQSLLHLNNNQLIIDDLPADGGDGASVLRMQSSTSTTDIRFPPLFVLDDNEVNGQMNLFSDTELMFYDCDEGQPSSGGHSGTEGEGRGGREDRDDGMDEEEYSSLLRDVKMKQEKLRSTYQSSQHPHHFHYKHPFDKYLLSKRDISVNPLAYLEDDNDLEDDEEEQDSHEDDDDGVEDDEEMQLLPSSNLLFSNPTNRRRSLKTKVSSESSVAEDEKETDSNKKKKSKRRFTLSSSSTGAPMYRPLLTPAQIVEMYGNDGSQSSSPTQQLAEKTPTTPPNARHLAGAIAEVLFVLVESVFWQIHRFWVYELKELYTVDPIEVFQRMLFCFIPGSHTTLLLSPDLYGPTMAVFILPQILLLSMDSRHHGCERSSLLRDALVVSFSLWGGLSVFYRLFAFLVAPAIRIRHCLCLSGYSFFSWNVALLVSYALRVYFPYLHIPPKLGLVLFSVPCAVAQGYVFWEYTPLSINPRHLPASWRRIADQHSRLTERVLWAIPKLLILIIVAVTHYQTLWYIARVFLPGRKHYCRLSALLNPANYADILTQKELREFTMKLLKKGVNHAL